MFRVHLTIDFDTETEATAAMSDMEEAAGKHNGDLQSNEVEDLDELYGGGE